MTFTSPPSLPLSRPWSGLRGRSRRRLAPRRRTKALERKIVKTDSNHVPTSVDAYTVVALKERFEDKDIATGLLLSLNKHRLTILCILGSNLTDHKKLGFRDEDALTKAHKSIDLKYLRHLN